MLSVRLAFEDGLCVPGISLQSINDLVSNKVARKMGIVYTREMINPSPAKTD